MLSVEELSVKYGSVPAVRGVSLTVRESQIVGLIGPNGAGKSSTVKAIVGAVRVDGGDILFAGESVKGCPPEDIVRKGIACVPEGRQVFGTLTVEENLHLGRTPLGRHDEGAQAAVDAVLTRFPVLKRRYRSVAATLSGGEQQQLAIGRALLAEPRLLILDEPSLGLAPKVVDMIFETLSGLRDGGVTILLVEQNAARTLELADHCYVLRVGRVALSGAADELSGSVSVADAYLGGVA